jgi:hypothetical protein
MHQDDIMNVSFEEYKSFEIQLHHELMNSCRKFIGRLNIVSILGILEIVKQEAIELESATRTSYKDEEVENKQ